MYRYVVRRETFGRDTDLQSLISRATEGMTGIPRLRDHVHHHKIRDERGELVAWFTVIDGRVVPVIR